MGGKEKERGSADGKERKKITDNGDEEVEMTERELSFEGSARKKPKREGESSAGAATEGRKRLEADSPVSSLVARFRARSSSRRASSRSSRLRHGSEQAEQA